MARIATMSQHAAGHAAPSESTRGVVVVKVSGDLLVDMTTVPSLTSLRDADSVLVVGGCGVQFSAWMQASGIEVRFVDGLRVTPASAISALREISQRSVDLLARVAERDLGRTALVLTSALRARAAPEALGCVGHITSVDVVDIENQLSRGVVPVLGPIVSSERGLELNVNADEIAAELAVRLGARELIFCTPFQGVNGADGTTIQEMDVAGALALIEQGTARSGMALKLREAVKAARSGCVVRILDQDPLSLGTRLHAGPREPLGRSIS